MEESRAGGIEEESERKVNEEGDITKKKMLQKTKMVDKLNVIRNVS